MLFISSIVNYNSQLLVYLTRDEILKNLICYKISSVWYAKSLPQSFHEKHNMQVGTWAKLHILVGSIDLEILTEKGKIQSKHHYDVFHQPAFILPQQWYRIAQVSEDLQCQLSFYCLPEDYTFKKYQMTKTHSEVLAASKIIPLGKVLDLGCGSGRNSLYLQLIGFAVTAVDKSELNISNLHQIINDGNLKHLSTKVYDINQANLEGEYDFILSTVVMMFLQPEKIPNIIDNMQKLTKSGGYNLIVSAMSTSDYPCSVGFSFTFKENELRDYYQDWKILKYNENVGELHKTDRHGNRIKLRFATLLAKKR